MAAVTPTVLAQGTVQGTSTQLPPVDLAEGDLVILGIAGSTPSNQDFPWAASPNIPSFTGTAGAFTPMTWATCLGRAGSNLVGEVITVTFGSPSAVGSYVLARQPRVPADFDQGLQGANGWTPSWAQEHFWAPCFLPTAPPLRSFAFLFHWPDAELEMLWPPWRLLAHQRLSEGSVAVAYTEGFPHVVEVRMSEPVYQSLPVWYVPCVDAACLLLDDEPVPLDRTNVLPLTEENDDGIWAVVT